MRPYLKAPGVKTNWLGERMIKFLGTWCPYHGEIYVTAGVNGTHASGSYHYGRTYGGAQANALDLGAYDDPAPNTKDQADMGKVADWLFANFKDLTIELIHCQPQNNHLTYVKNQVAVGPYGPASAHVNHIHWATSSVLLSKMEARAQAKWGKPAVPAEPPNGAVKMTIKYYDVSHYQGDYHPTGPTVAKATEGTTFKDARYATNKSRTLSGGWPFAAYHFLTTANPVTQASFAYSVIGKTPTMLDFETVYDGTKPSLATAVAFIDAYRKLGGLVTLVYLPRWYWQAIGSPSLKPFIDRGLALVSSNYTTYSDTGPGWTAYGGMTPKIWQFTSTPLDTNAFKGTVEELRRLFGGLDMPINSTDAQTIASKISVDLNNDASGIAIGVRKLVDEALADNFAAVLAKVPAPAPTAAEIAAAVVAALPPAATGGITAADVEAAVISALGKIKVVPA